MHFKVNVYHTKLTNYHFPFIKQHRQISKIQKIWVNLTFLKENNINVRIDLSMLDEKAILKIYSTFNLKKRISWIPFIKNYLKF
nr:hypothetical protein [Campylobacter jejuni]